MKTMTHEIRQLCRAHRAQIAIAIAGARRGDQGPRIELVVSSPHPSKITLPVHVEQLSPGAREAIERGLWSLWNGDDASTLRVRTGRTKGEAATAEMERVRKLPHGADLIRCYGLDDPARLTDDSPEIERVRWSSMWSPEAETPEEYLSRVLEPYAGRIVSAGLH